VAWPADVAPLGGVVRPRRKVRFARLLHRRGRTSGPDRRSGPPSAASRACLGYHSRWSRRLGLRWGLEHSGGV